jgi:hypothetical protein
MLKLTAWSCAEAGTAAASAAVSPRPVPIDRHMGVLLLINPACSPAPQPDPADGRIDVSGRSTPDATGVSENASVR